jgi:hypothetical protein
VAPQTPVGVTEMERLPQKKNANKKLLMRQSINFPAGVFFSNSYQFS